MKVGVSAMLVLLAFGISAAISAFVFHDHHHRKMFIGSVGLVASVAMYGSPLVVVVSNPIHIRLTSIHSVKYVHIYMFQINVGCYCKCHTEKSHSNKECGVHALLPVSVLISL